MSTYTQLMADGNARYASATADRSKTEVYAKEAYAFYSRALHLARSSSDVASVYKNMAKAGSQVVMTSGNGDVQRWYFIESLTNGSLAMINGTIAQRDPKWLEDMSDFLLALLRYVTDNAHSLDWGASITALLLPLVRCTRHHVALRLPASIIILRKAWRSAFNAVDEPEALRILQREESLVGLCHEMTKLVCGGVAASTLKEEALELIKDYRISLNDAEAARCLRVARAALKTTLQDAVEVFEDNAFHCIDTLRAAVTYAAISGSLKIEAEANCLLGHCFSKYLHHLFPSVAALRMYQQGVHCALSGSSGVPYGTWWFREALDAVEEHQDEISRHLSEETTAQNEKLKGEIKEELSALKSANTSAQDLVMYLRTTYTKETDELKAVDKKVLQKLLLMFHPDKLPKDAKPSTALLYEEIAKAILAHYEAMKL